MTKSIALTLSFAILYICCQAQKDVKWFKQNQSFVPPSCSIINGKTVDVLGMKVEIKKGGPHDIIELEKGWFLKLYVPEHKGTHAKVELPTLYEDTDFIKVVNEYYRSLDEEQRQVTYNRLSDFYKYFPEYVRMRRTVKVKGGKIKKIERGEQVRLITAQNAERIKVVYQGEPFDIDPSATWLIYDIRRAINPEKSYVGNDKLYVKMPMGERSFADGMVNYHFGTSTDKADLLKPFLYEAIGEPNSSKHSIRSHLTGCKGLLTLAFTDNVLVDGPGVDLYVFNGGKIFYNMLVYVSEDGYDWIQVDYVGKDQPAVDLSPFVSPKQQFRYVKLIHQGGCSYRGNYIDAVGAINTKLIGP